jgi:hypothetical protein
VALQRATSRLTCTCFESYIRKLLVSQKSFYGSRTRVYWQRWRRKALFVDFVPHFGHVT